jgi:uncharacterized damage-inducible protein DinB
MSNNITKEIIDDLNETTQNLLQTISLFDQTQFNQIPYKGGWTAGQVAEHIFKSESGIPIVLNGDNKQTSRPPDQNIEQIKNSFLDFTSKMKSPDFILPTEDKKSREELFENLKINRAKIINIANSIDLSKTYYMFPFPGIGEMTGLEWLTFAICHSKRHTRQMKNIHEVLNR